MTKILIIGMVASGKTTFARKLSKKLKVPHFEVDVIIRKITEKERVKLAPDEQIDVIKGIDSNGDWIIEGTYRKSCHLLLDISDKIIFLDPPLKLRKYRILSRYIKQQLRIEKCHYKSNLWMLKMMFKWTRDFEKGRDEFENMLSDYSHKLEVINDSSQLKRYLI